MAGNRFGTLFQYQSWGESHGPAIGCVVDGVPSQIPLSEEDIQIDLDKRKPGQSKFTTKRKEPDQVKILSGVFEGVTTGAPISLLIENQDQRSKDYSDIQDKFRPGHADYTYQQKYGIRDYRGGGRASARETAMRVAAGAIAKKILKHAIGTDFEIYGAVTQIGSIKIDYNRWDQKAISQNPFWCPDAHIVAEWEELITKVRKEGSSVGAMIEVRASGVPAGLGEPVYDKLDADIAKAMMSINAVKSVEIGSGFEAASMEGKMSSDQMSVDSDQTVQFASNHAGGILGGISTGQEIITRFAVKPTSSILTPQQTITKDLENSEILTKGRHDPCVGIRAVPVGEAMLACVLADHYLRLKAYK